MTLIKEMSQYINGLMPFCKTPPAHVLSGIIVTMYSKPGFHTLLQLGQVAAAFAAPYTWPSDTDFLESLLYEQVGHDAFTPAAVVAPCGNVVLGKGRSVPAEWIRTAYHDMATADVAAGTGGMDASIGFELDRAENPGLASFTETLGNMKQHLTSRSSMADLIAMGAIVSVGACSNGSVLIPFRTGRVDAKEAGPKGVPEPQQEIDSHVSAFKRQGFNKAEMIGLVACGHTLGGVHGVDFPTIVPVPVNDPVSYELPFWMCCSNVLISSRPRMSIRRRLTIQRRSLTT